MAPARKASSSTKKRPYSKHGFCRQGATKPPLWYVYQSMIRRCEDPDCPGYSNYGGRGIRVCAGWKRSFSAFLNWALANGYRRGLQIDRRNNERGYFPNNCRFVTAQVNARNRRTNRIETAFGESRCVAEWAEDPRCAVTLQQLQSRIRKPEWTFERALTTPISETARRHGAKAAGAKHGK